MAGSKSTLRQALLAFWFFSACAVTVNLALEYREAENAAKQQLIRQAQLLDQHLVRQLRAAASALGTLRREVPGFSGAAITAASITEHLQSLSSIVVGARTLIVLDATGRATHSNRSELVGRDFSARQYFQAARSAGRTDVLLISPPFRTVLGINAFNVTYALHDASGHFDGAITATLEPEFHQSLLEAARFAPGVWAGLAHSNGWLISTAPQDPESFGRNLAVPGSLFLRHREGAGVESVLEGIAAHTGALSVLVQRSVKAEGLTTDSNLEIAVAQDKRSMMASWRDKAAVHSIVLMSFVAVSGFVAATWRQRQRSLEVMEAERAAAQEKSHLELLRSHKFLQDTLDAIPVAVFVKDTESKLLFINKTAESLWGTPAPALVGTDAGAVSLPDQLEKHLETDRIVIAGRKAADWVRPLWNAELRQNRIVHSFKSPLLDAQGEVSLIVGTHIDITEQVNNQHKVEKALRDKEALLREVHHRVKNNLQVFSSLLRLEGARIEHPATQAMLQDMQGRVRSMALLHETLYRSDGFASVDLAAYLESLAVQASRNFGASQTSVVKLQHKLESVQVGIDQATPCGLLVFELLSNAYEHAFSDGKVGSILLELHAAQTPGHWILRVSDDGIGLPTDFEQRQTQSLGMQLVIDLSRQMGGKLTYPRPVAQGAAFEVEFLALLVDSGVT